MVWAVCCSSSLFLLVEESASFGSTIPKTAPMPTRFGLGLGLNVLVKASRKFAFLLLFHIKGPYSKAEVIEITS